MMQDSTQLKIIQESNSFVAKNQNVRVQYIEK